MSNMTIGEKAVTLTFVGGRTTEFSLSYVSCLMVDPELRDSGHFRITVISGGNTHVIRRANQQEVDSLRDALGWRMK